MTINYKGMDADYRYRTAEIYFNDDEKQLMIRLEDFLERIKGWKSSGICGDMCIFEVNDIDEYKEFVADYKEAKKMLKNCIKFGF